MLGEILTILAVRLHRGLLLFRAAQRTRRTRVELT